MTTIAMQGDTLHFYQGVSAGQKVLDAHADIDFPDHETRVKFYWFYVGALGAGEYELTEFDAFALGAKTREPSNDGDDE